MVSQFFKGEIKKVESKVIHLNEFGSVNDVLEYTEENYSELQRNNFQKDHPFNMRAPKDLKNGIPTLE